MGARILAFSGSLRRDSWNQKLVSFASRGVVDSGGVVNVVSLRDFPLPVFSEDLEAESGAPESAVRLKQLLLEHDGLLISSPEYNSSVTAALKNALDWVSRRATGEGRLKAFSGKTAGLLAASPGALGGLRGLVHLRAILGNIGVTVIPEQFALAQADRAFDEKGNLIDSAVSQSVLEVARNLTRVTQLLNP